MSDFKTMKPYEGLLTAMVTPFHENGAVNDEAAINLARYLLSNGSDGLVVTGTTGEAATLEDDELVGLVELIVGEFGDRASIVAGTGSNNTAHAVRLTERVVEAGAHGTLNVTPYYNKPTPPGIVRHYEEVAKAAGGTPVVVYNNPARTVINMPTELLKRLAQIDGIEAVKQSNGDDLELVDGMAVTAGDDPLYERVLEIGGVGGICVASHIVGLAMKRMMTEPNERASISATLQDVYATLGITTNPIPIKTALKLLGHDVGGFRLPMVEANEQEVRQIQDMLLRQELLEGVPVT